MEALRKIKEVLPDGTIIGIRGSPLSQPLRKNSGYKSVTVRLDGRAKRIFSHRLVWAFFNGAIPEGMEIDHIDGDKTNNSIENLQLLSPEDNRAKASAKTWKFVSPENEEVTVHNLHKFCKSSGLSYKALWKLHNNKIKNYKGWTK